MTEPTTDRPTDTIRDAFEAMLAFLRLLMTPWKMPLSTDPQLAIEAARILGSWPNSPHMWNLSDLIQRAAEEHNRRAAAGGDFTPERIREARERCERATPGPWVHSPPGVDEPHVSTKIGSDGERVNWLASPRSAPSKRWHDAAFIAHAREDLPAALAEIERLNRLVVATANADPSWVERCTTQAAEIERLATALQAERAAWQEASGADSPGHLTAALKARRARLTAELAARVPALFDGPPRTLYQPNGPDGRPEDAGAPADASLEARAWPQRGLTRAEFDKRLAFIVSDMSSEDAAWLRSRLASYAGWETDPGRWAAIAAIEGAAEGSGMRFARMRDLSEALVGLAVVRAVDASRPAAPEVDDDEPLTRGTRVRTVAHLTALFAPSLHPHRRSNALGKIVRRMTSGDIYYDVRHDDGTVAGYERSELIDLTADASRPGLTEEQARLDFETACREARARGGAYCITKLGEALSTLDAALRASRGETGPAPTGLTSAMHAAQQRRSVPPASAFGEWPDEPRGGLTCPGCYDATGIAQPHDPRATLHAGDPASPFAPGSLAAGSATEDRILDRKRGGK